MSELGDRLWELPLPESEQAPGQTARRVSERVSAPPARSSWRRRLAPAVAVPLLAFTLVAFAFTPPGRAITGEIGELVGVGQVGGPPSEPSEVGQFDAATEQVILAVGTTADDAPFEIVAYRSDRSIMDRKDSTICVNSEFPGTSGQTVSGCYAGALRYGAQCCPTVVLADAASSVPRVEGEIRPGVKRVEVTYNDAAGSTRTVEATIGMIDRKLAERLEIKYPSGLYLASLPGLAEQRDLPQPLQGPARPITITAYGAANELLETETVDPISERTIRQMTDARARSYALDRFRMECVEPGGEGDVRRQELSRRCKGLLDAIP